MAAKKIKAAKAGKSTKVGKIEMPPPPRSKPGAPPAVVHRTTAEISVSQQHSFELARTVMTATISTVVSLRKIFPRHRFAIRTYDCADPEVTYDAFMDGISGKFSFERSDDLLNWKILSRNTNDSAVNKLLDWIEIAATDALKKKYLAKLQLSFHTVDGSEVSDANLLEAYNICFTYDNGQMLVGTAEGKKTSVNSVVLRGAKADLYTLVNDVVLMIQERDHLPADRRMNMMLLYNNTCPPEYEPPGFHANHDPNRLIASDKGVEVGSMNTGFHGMSVQLYQQSPQYSHDQKHSTKRRRTRQRSRSMSSEIDGDGTQEQGLRMLQRMGNYRAQGTQDTQSIGGKMYQTVPKGEVLIPSQDFIPTFLPYSQSIMERIDRMRGNKSVRQAEYDLDEVRLSERRVTCECGVLADEGRLIQCDLCDDFKHIICYGHLGSLPPTSKFACYSCLLDIEGDLLSQMKVTCIKRRALYYLRDQDRALNSIADLAQYLDLDEDATEDILGQLEPEGYLKRAMGYKKTRKGKSISTEPLFTLVVDDQVLLNNIFRPDLDIPHKLLLPNSTSPGSVTMSENDNEGSEHDLTWNSVGFVPSSGRAQGPVRNVQPEASTTQGTPSPRSAVACRFPGHQNQSQAQNRQPLSSGSSFVHRKRPHDSLTEHDGLAIDEGGPGMKLNRTSANVSKISAVNSPWTFKRSDL